MVTVNSYPYAIGLCVITMICWGSWANMQKLAKREWPFQLFYWDYGVGVLILSLLLAFSLGSYGALGRPFLADIGQADSQWLLSAFVGGIIFNLSNILLVAAIDIAGMAIAFPVGVGVALCLGVITTYLATKDGNPVALGLGVGFILLAIILDALAYRALLKIRTAAPNRGVLVALAAGILMGLFYSFVARSLGTIDPVSHALEPLKLSPYTAIVLFSAGVFLSNFLWNSLMMRVPFTGRPVAFSDYRSKGNARLHLVGIAGGMIWSLGMALSIIASAAAGPALSYGLGQGATLVGALWGVFVWKEFRGAPTAAKAMLAAMFVCYVLGLVILIGSKA